MIFVAGLSGVGKTSAIDWFVLRHPEFEHLRASCLLKELGRPLSNLTLQEISENQYELNRLLRGRAISRRTILDGHLVLPTGSGTYRVSTDFFDGIPLTAFVFLWAEPSILLRRRDAELREDTLRLTEELQKAALNHARSVAVHYGRPIEILNSDDRSDFEEVLLHHGQI